MYAASEHLTNYEMASVILNETFCIGLVADFSVS